MDIVIGRTAPVSQARAKKRDPSDTARKKKKEDRRKNQQDRRQSVRDGVVVRLSTKKDRRNHKDRRKKNPVGG
jgi:hypothetical protein